MSSRRSAAAATTARPILAVLVGMSLSAVAAAAATPELATLFSLEARVRFVGDGDGLAALALPPEVLARCRPDLSDLRLFDAADRELPFLLVSGGESDSRLEERLTAEVLDVARREVRREEGPPLFRETYELRPPPTPTAGDSWQLIAEPDRGSFVASVTIESIEDSAAVRDLLSDGSIYRLDDPPRRRLRVDLPAIPPPTRRLQVTFESEEGGYLSPRLLYVSSRGIDTDREAEAPLEIRELQHDGGQTTLELGRPRGLMPSALRLESSTPGFRRPVTVWDEGPNRVGTALGTGTVLRLPGRVAISETAVEVAAARGDRLRVVIGDGDSPPLADLRVVALLRAPALVFAPPRGEPTATLRFGGGRAHPPRYDLQQLLAAGATTGAAAVAATRALEAAAAPRAELGEISRNPRYDPTPALGFALRSGGAVDPRSFSHRRELRVVAAPEGLVHLPLELSDLAVARADLGDLRLVDAEDRQWAYLLEPAATVAGVDLTVEGPLPERGSRSRYLLSFPSAPARISGVVVDTPVPFFDRPFELLGIDVRGDEVVLAEGRLVRPIGDPRAATLSFPPHRLEALVLTLHDGDDAPLAPLTAQGLFPLPELFAAVPPGDYRLLLGNPEQEAPRYELARVRDVVLGVDATLVEPGSLEKNPAFRSGLRWASRSGAQRLLLWLVLGIAVIGLGVMTLRLARSDDQPGV